MEDSSTTQPTDDTGADNSSATTEPALSLGTNPSDQTQPDSTSTTTAPVSDDQTVQSEQSSSDVSVSTEEPAADQPAIDIQPSVSASSDDLETIKSSALNDLAPLVGELDQNPEDKYRTLMMLIQSSDDQKLIKDAYDAAQNIEDKKTKAEALLNIVNEINYFTGKDKPEGSGSENSPA